ncbi:MAG: hypothetical protein EFT35_00145 [Methanophagales archaeon ANME-1-THS]|nr:MAG: hypothetical protein EFT35_00145 [Methanophagales archaeon ANME-1-THS]
MASLEGHLSLQGADHSLGGGKRQSTASSIPLKTPLLRGEEEKGLLKQVEAQKLTMAEFEAKRRHAEVICILSDMEKEGIDIFDLYKGREDVELAFDAIKNYT